MYGAAKNTWELPPVKVLVMAALAVCAVAAAQLRERADSQAPPPVGPDEKPPLHPGLVPLSVREVKRLLAAARRPPSPAARSRPATPPAGSSGDAATRHYRAGSTNAHAWHATTPWSSRNQGSLGKSGSRGPDAGSDGRAIPR
jgi:hypothetical protein